jgi:hypothetical protein
VERVFLAKSERGQRQRPIDCPELRRYGLGQGINSLGLGTEVMIIWLTPWNFTLENAPSGDFQGFKKESFFISLLFASCTHTFSKWCKITRGMKRSAQ